jgi:hypothetical protein
VCGVLSAAGWLRHLVPAMLWPRGGTVLSLATCLFGFFWCIYGLWQQACVL